MKPSMLSAGFVAGGLANVIGVLTVSRFFTNNTVSEYDPTVMSTFGLICIVLWGLAYIATSRITDNAVQWLAAVFAVEKVLYVVVWLIWMSGNWEALPDIYANDWLTGLFYSVYGLNDLLFAVFFGYAFLCYRKASAV
jgi:hypothetical protein